MVDTVEQAKVAIAAAKYPPIGNRSVGGGMTNLNFNASNQQYYDQANDEVIVILQTESPTGVENAEEIYALPGVDAIFIGPNDLRYQMRDSDGTFPTAEDHEAMVQEVIEVGKKVGTPTGIHTMAPSEALTRAQQGMQFLAIGSDMMFLSQAAHKTLQEVKPESASEGLARY